MKDKWQRLKNWFMNKHNLHMIIGGFFLGVVLDVAGGLNPFMPSWWVVILYINFWYASKPKVEKIVLVKEL